MVRWRSRVATWARSTAAGEPASRLLWSVQAVQQDTYLPSAGSASNRAARAAEPDSYLILGVYYFFTCLAWAALQLPGVEVKEVPM
jgi:hypothetical protein